MQSSAPVPVPVQTTPTPVSGSAPTAAEKAQGLLLPDEPITLGDPSQGTPAVAEQDAPAEVKPEAPKPVAKKEQVKE